MVRDIRNRFVLRGREIERAVAGADLADRKGLRHLQAELTRLGVDDALRVAGAKAGEIVQIGALEFEYEP